MSESSQGRGGRQRLRNSSCITTGIVGAQHRGDRGGQGHGRGHKGGEK
ncbi:MAG: hypothetical protein N2V72_00160 [Methanophagales archaeon]|nr:hypothetical protein [Methanophagales archaeon]